MSQIVMMGSEGSAQLRRVAVADDSGEDVHLLLRARQRTGVPWAMTVFADGEEAIQHLQGIVNANLPEMLLLDLKMPRVDGFEVLDWIGRNMPGRIRTIVFSASRWDCDIERARELGAERCIVKPGAFHELLVILQTLEQMLSQYDSPATGE